MFPVSKYHNRILSGYGIRVVDKVHARRLVLRPAGEVFAAADKLSKERQAALKKDLESAHDKKTAKDVMAELYPKRPPAEPPKKASAKK
jgi:hypothetical protein